MLPVAPSSRSAARSRAQHLLWWLVLAMLLAPVLGRVHQVLHPPQWQSHAPGHSHAHGGAAPLAASRQGDDDAWLLALFVGHSHSDCQLHDQLNAWASPFLSAQALAADWLHEIPRHVEWRIAFAGSAAFFDPRAPPAAA